MSATLAIAALVAACGRLEAPSPGEPSSTRPRVENFALLDHDGRFHELYYYSDAAAIVLFVHGNDCQIVRDSLPALRRASRAYEEHGVVFLMLNANLQDDRASIAADAAGFEMPFPILVDETQLVAESLDVTRTAEVLVIDPADWRLAYRGPVDDRRGYGSRHADPSRVFLTEALDAVLAGAPVDLSPPPTQGCLVTLPGPELEEISYSRDIAPILLRRCVRCHHDGGIAPWPMDGHDRVRGWSAMMREVVRTRRMPPWDADPHVGAIDHSLALTVDETRALVHWIEAGAPRGTGPDPLPEQPPTSDEWPLGEPDVVLPIEPQEVAATGLLPYRYVQLENPLDRDLWVRAADLRPSNPRVLHHSLVFQQSEATRHVLGELFTKFNPGSLGDPFPEGTGKLLPAGGRLLVELHYTPTGRPETDTPRLGLYLSAEPPERELVIEPVTTLAIRIPPHTKRHPVAAAKTFEHDVLLYKLQAHMHYRGREMRTAAIFPDGTRETLLSVPSYDFDFQWFYDLETPRLMPAGTTLRCDGSFDNSAQNEANPDPDQEVAFGLQTTDEMFICYVVYTVVGEEPPVAV